MAGYVLLGRPDCHLCEAFLEALEMDCPALVPELTLADVDSRTDWQQRFGLRIPVLIDANGAVVCEGHFDARRLAGP